MSPVSVLIITLDEEKNIQRALESVQWADEIVVLDSFSKDNTGKIASSFPKVRFVQHEFKNFTGQRKHGLTLVKNDWVLELDADEEVTRELQEEIVALSSANYNGKNAFYIKRDNYFMGKKIRFSGWQNDKPLRLFHKEKIKFKDLEVHEQKIAEPPVGQLKATMTHYTYQNFKEYYAKFDRYSSLSARDKLKKTSKITYFHLLVKPWFRFLKQYFFRLGFLDGKVGFIICKMAAYSVFLRYLKAWRILEKEEV